MPRITSKTSHLPALAEPWAQSQSVVGRWIRREPLELETLPLDILLEIMKQLDWLDVLRLRQVSWTLYLASKDKSVWAVISSKHEDERFPPSHFFEKQIWALTASELEEAFLRPRKVDAAWTKSSVSYRIVDIGTDATEHHLLPGGRWFLAANKSGDIVYYDLHSPSESLVPRILVESPPSAIAESLFTVDVSSSKGPHLTFNIVVATARLTPSVSVENGEGSHLLQVAHVEPKFDEGGHIIELSSSLLSCFETGRLWLEQLRLSGPYVGYYPASSWTNSDYCVVEWERANGRGRSFERRWVYVRPAPGVGVHFLPGDALATIGRIRISLVNIKLLPLSTVEARPQADRKPAGELWSRFLAWTDIGCFTGPCEVPGGFLFFLSREWLWQGQDYELVYALTINDAPGAEPASLQPCCVCPFSHESLAKRDSFDYLKFTQVAKANPDHPAILRHGRFVLPPPDNPCELPFNKVPSTDIIIPSKLFDMLIVEPFLSFDGLSGCTVASQTASSWVIFSIVI